MDGRNGESVEVRVLGPLLVLRGRDAVELGPPRQRAVLALLAMYPNEVVSVDRLIDQVWAGEPPASALGTVQAYISNLRRALERNRVRGTPPRTLVTEAPGYVLRVDRARVDALRFEDDLSLARQVADADDVAAALGLVERALGHWRGSPLADFEYADFALAWRSRLDELRAGAEELRIDLLLASGQSSVALAELGLLVERWPLHEGLRARQVLALARTGRHADALRAYEQARRHLGEEAGLLPGPELESVYQRVLAHEEDTVAPPRPVARPATVEPASQPAGRSGDAFVGRADQLALIAAAVRPAFVVISGEPGIGKTRLAEEALGVARRSGELVAMGRCHDDEGAPPLWPIHQVLAELGVADTAGFAGERSKEAGADLFVRFEQIRLALEGRAEEAPVVVLLDDLQWADLSSLRLLTFLATELRSDRVKVIVTVRNTDVVPGSPVSDTLGRLARADALQVALDGLDADAVADLVESATGSRPAGDTAASLVGRTGGNPFYVGELVRLWSSRGVSPAVPRAVADVVRPRLARLPDRTQKTLLMAAVLGRSFDVAVLSRALGEASETTMDDLDGAIATGFLVDDTGGRMRFIHALVAETLVGDVSAARLGRLHLRAADALDESGQAGGTVHPAEVARHLDQVVRLLGDSYVERASHAAYLAFEASSAGGAFADAAAWAETALRHAERASAAPVYRSRLLVELALARFDAGERERAGEAQREAIRLARTLTAPARALALVAAGTIALQRPRPWQWRGLYEVDEVVVGALEQALLELPDIAVAWRVRALSSLAIELLATEAGPERGESLTARAVELARDTDDVELLAEALLTRVLALDMAGGRPAQLEAIEEVLALDRSRLSNRMIAVALTWRVGLRIALAQGAIGQDALSAELYALTRDVTDPTLRLTADWGAVTLHFFRARFDAAHKRALVAYRRQRSRGEVGAAALWLAHEGVRRRELGTLPDDAREMLVDPPSRAHDAVIRRFEIRLAAAVGDRARAAALVEEFAPRTIARNNYAWMIQVARLLEAAAMCDSPWTAELYGALLPYRGEVILRWPYPVHGAVDLYLGLGARSLRDRPAALEHLAEAIRIHDLIEAIPYALRSRVEYAQTLIDLGEGSDDRCRAMAVLDEIADDLKRFGFVDLAQRSAALRS